ncbi:uncharacterized protein LOC132730435 isoform X3 [Ruditapes philippinarum]|uniref:uncharacterized protein LOC132730435 isoform X3 n=1 Tax=Ruditapes philippinarum TaxID=129788 RepID=UPI00295AC7DF|nr:uncharacterized protein LOC132730435 isoform X3 [Ruditapes philippinarum]
MRTRYFVSTSQTRISALEVSKKFSVDKMLRIKLGGVFGSPPPTKRKYRQYSPSSLDKAYQCAVEGELSVRKASKVYGVPMQTLRDRVLGHIEPDTTRSGPGPLLSEFEEAKLVDHIKDMAYVGYPYTRAEVINTATEFATCLGARMRDELMEDASPGAQGTVTKSGWSNGEVFQKYLQTHFVKYATGKRPILLLYDGHRSHITPFIIDWAIEQNIILYVLPPHTSHILQPMDVGCFGPFAKIYSQECNKFQRFTGRVVDKYSVCAIACKAYSVALSVKNLQSAFMKSGIYPFNPDKIDTSLFKTHELRASFVDEDTVSHDHLPAVLSTADSDETVNYAENESVAEDSELLTAVPLDQVTSSTLVLPQTSSSECTSDVASSFFRKKRPVFKPPFKKERRSISKIVAGKAITEPTVAADVKDYISNTQRKSTATATKGFRTPSKSLSAKGNPKPSSSGTSKSGGPIDLSTPPLMEDSVDDDSVVDDDDDELCCVCNKFQPEELSNCHVVTFLKWAKCDFCEHWTHLIYCSEVRVVRRGDEFRCPHC